MSLAIRNGTVVTEGAVLEADVIVNEGRVAALIGRGSVGAPDAGEMIDASDCYVLPGIVDPHVHVATPGDPNMDPIIETLAEATASGVLGGVTSVCSYVRAVPGQTIAQAVDAELEAGRDGAQADFGFNLLCTPDDDLDEAVAEGRARGVSTFKGMLAYRTRGLMLDDRRLLHLMTNVAKAGGTLLVHAENGLATEHFEYLERSKDEMDRGAYLRTSPGPLEAEGAFRAASLAALVDCPIIFVHMSARETAAIARDIRERIHPGVVWETQPHYMLMTNESLLERGPLAKVGPPLRHIDDTVAIRDAATSGLLSHFSSDHAPRDRSTKLSRDSILDAPYGGTSGTELLFPLVYEQLHRQAGVPIERIVELVSTNAARAYGLFPRKGTLRPGSEADIVVAAKEYDPRKITAEDLNGKSDYSIYEGLTAAPAPRAVLRHGVVVAREGVREDARVPAQYLARS